MHASTRSTDTRTDTPSSGTRNLQWWLTIPLLLITSWLAISHLTFDTLWIDEVLTISLSGGAHYGPITAIDVVEKALYADVWPPLYHLAFHYWGAIAGWTPLAGRYLAFLFGLLTLALAYRLGREMHSHNVGLTTVLILTTSPLFIYYLHEYRGYTFHLAFALLTLWLYWRISRTDERASRGQRVTLVLSVAALLYTHPLSIALVAGLMVYHFLFAPRTAQWSHTVFLIGVGGLLFVPWLILPTIAKIVAEDRDPRGMSTVDVLETALYTFSNGVPFLLVAFGGYAALRLRGRAVGFLVFIITTFLVAALVINIAIDYLFHIRHLLVLTPLLAVLFSIALYNLRRVHPILPIALLIGWMSIGMFHILDGAFMDNQPGAQDPLNQEHFANALDFLDQRTQPEDAVYFQLGAQKNEPYNDTVLEYYMPPLDIEFAQITVVAHHKSGLDLTYAEKVLEFVGSAPYVWIVTMPRDYPPEDVEPLKQELTILDYTPCGTVHTNPNFEINVYAHQSCMDLEALRLQ
ncbi:MAG: glycosyltransferase family 39 protein [Anaerolineae bacterium]|nr:glycosyltransferase family 39 protein [Anaerolineae bacterium]